MKRGILIFALLCVLLSAVLAACVRVNATGHAPVVTGSVTGVIVAAGEREVVLQTQEDGAPALRSLRLADDLVQPLAVGDEVVCTTQINVNNKETVVKAQVLSHSAVDTAAEQEAAQSLPQEKTS